MELSETIDEHRLTVIRDYIDRMPSLPTAVTRVLDICSKPSASPNDLNKVISLDPVLTDNVLKLINSAYYSLPNQITSLGRAIIMLGLNTVKNLALITAILGTLKKSGALNRLPFDTFWTHCLGVGVTAKAIAAQKNIPVTQHEEYFVAGLLHDLGKVALNNCFAGVYGQALSLADLEQGPLYKAEKTMLGLDHALVGQEIAEKWQFSSTISQAISFHHRPTEAAKETRLMVAIISLANIYTNICNHGFAGDGHPGVVELKEALELVAVDWSDLQQLNEKVVDEIEKARIFLKVGRVEE